MVTETVRSSASSKPAGASMADVIKEAWLATAELDEVADASTRQSAFVLVLEAMLRNGESATGTPDRHDSNRFDDSFEVVEQDDLYPTPELRTDAISAYLGIKPDQVSLLFSVAQATPLLQLSTSRLEVAQRLELREIVLLLLGGRTAIALDTELDDIRRAVQESCRGAEPLAAETLQSSPEWVVLGIRGSDRKIVRLREIGVAAAREIAQRLVAE